MQRQRPIPILMYHSIADMPKGTVMRSLHVPPKRFRFQMRILKWLGYRGLSMGELLPYLKGDKQGKVVGITFDDGYRNNLTEALPVLQKFEFSATCYIISRKIGGINEWDLDKGIPENPLMDSSEIQQWIDGGMEIGAHSCDHVRLTECSEQEAAFQIQQSKLDLEQRFSSPIYHFCYPYGLVNDSVLKNTEEAGYHTVTTVARGRIQPINSILQLPRVAITHHTLPHLFLLKILSKYEDRHE